MNDDAVLLKKTKWMMMLWNIKQMAIDEMNDDHFTKYLINDDNVMNEE